MAFGFSKCSCLLVQEPEGRRYRSRDDNCVRTAIAAARLGFVSSLVRGDRLLPVLEFCKQKRLIDELRCKVERLLS